MKRIIIIILGIGLLVGLGIFTARLISNKGKSDGNLAAFNFEIQDTASVNKIIITEPNGMEMTLIRNGNSWTDDKGQCVQPIQVFNILEALYNVRFKGYVPERSVVIPGSYTKTFPAGEFQVPCALIIGKRKESTDLKTSLNQALRENNVVV